MYERKYSQKGAYMRSFYKLYLLLIFLSVMGMSWGGVGVQNTYATSISADSVVIIASDLTSPSCKITRIFKSSMTHIQPSKTQTRCPAGTVIGIEQLPLHLAVTRHEKYILPLPPQASPSMKVEWFLQIQQLMNAKRNLLKALPSPEIISTSCGYDEETSTANWFFGTWISYAVYYHVLLDCQHLVLNREEVKGYNPVNSPAYWLEVRYSYFRATCPLHYNYVGANDLNYYPNVTESSGFYNIWGISTGNGCLGQSGAYEEFSVLL